MKKVSVDKARRNRSTVADRAGKKEPKRLGFMRGEIEVPDDFDRMDEKEIAALFEQDPLETDVAQTLLSVRISND